MLCADEHKAHLALDDRHRRHRQVAARLGALQVPRRHHSGHGLAPWPLPGLRRRRDVLGARRDDPHARRNRRGRGRRDGVVEARRRSRESSRRRRGTRVDPAARRPAPVARRALGLEQAELFAGWRLFFERLAERDPVVLVFEDMQWADAPLLEFVAYLLEWSRNHAILAVALARPGSAEEKAQWAAGLRNATTLSLEPLSTEAMEALLDGFVRGSPTTSARRSSSVRKGFPSTPSRQCACSSTVACSSRRATSTVRRARSRHSRYPKPSRR